MKKSVKELKVISRTIRKDILTMLTEAGSGHTAGSLGMTDIFTCLYFSVLKHNPKKPMWKDRDILILSNGHICPVRYAAMAEAGYFPKKDLLSLRKLNSKLQGHPSRLDIPALELSTASLGQGISAAIGFALARKSHVFCIVSDGELDEGSCWEAFMFANKYKIKNLTYIIDRNKIQIDGTTNEIMPLLNLKNKFKSFGLKVYNINGHNHKQIIKTLNKTKKTKQTSVVIANTIPGKGVKSIEGKWEWHGKVPSREQYAEFVSELN